MGRGLVATGALLLAVTVSLWVAEAAGWLPTTFDDRISRLTLHGALACLAGGLALRLLSPVRSQLARGRCRTCGRPTERGHPYCLDHMQESVNAWRDASREGMLRKPRARG